LGAKDGYPQEFSSISETYKEYLTEQSKKILENEPEDDEDDEDVEPPDPADKLDTERKLQEQKENDLEFIIDDTFGLTVLTYTCLICG
jgi:hypothetical protein